MKAIPWRSATVILVGALGVAGCGKDSTSSGNAAPVANFTSDCTNLVCSFADISSDPDGTVSTLSWDFGDNGNGNGSNPTHTYTAGGDYTVTLTATDNDGDETAVSKEVTVVAAQNGAPTANFSVVCNSLDCTFADLSTDADGLVVGWDWDFGDGSTHSAAQNPPVHSYVSSGVATYRARLTVTDNAGLTSTKSTEFTVSPAATLQCESAPGTGQFASCDLVIAANSTVSVTLQSASCTAHGNIFEITAPVAEELFSDGCYATVPATFNLNGGAVFAAGTHLMAQVISGSTKQEIAPALHVEGAYPTWTLKFDDGEDATPPEPDFDDLVMTVTATPQ